MPNPPIKRPYCTPPGKPRIINVPVCPPTFRGGFVTPFGGPASGISTAGGVPVEAAATGPSVVPTPAPGPTCVTAEFFAECFTGCDGVGNCGWVTMTPAGTVIFDGSMILEGSSGANTQGLVRKPLPVVPTPGFFTAQFQVTEIVGPPNINKTYAVGAFDAAANSIFSIALSGAGTFFFGDDTDIYTGVWTPVSGATHTVHISKNGPGTLLLWIDGALIPLVFLAPGPITDVPSVVSLSIDNDDLDGMGSYDSVFLAAGALPLGTEFCCPLVS